MPRRGRCTLIATSLFFGVLLFYCFVTVAEGYLRASDIVGRNLASRPAVLRADSLSPEQLTILLTVEDPAFFRHHGLDFHTPGAGMTTIAQGLVKFLYFESFYPGIAKCQQSLLAVGFDARIDKKTQLAILLNSGYMGQYRGREVHGFDEAAHAYFGRSFAQLTRGQYIALVAMCVGPNEFSVASHPQRNADRVARIERLLRGECRPTGWLDVYYKACGPSKALDGGER
jgi:membrane peptidoglycan carboxypeptidase